MTKLRSVSELGNVAGKTVLLVTNLDVPVADEQVLNNFRIQAAIPTIKLLQSKGARIVILSKLGRPDGKYQDNLSLMPVRFELGRLMDEHIKFAHIPTSRNSIVFMEDGEILLLENSRFHPGEESTKPSERKEFVKELADLADYYVNDDFATYRPSATNYELPTMVKNPMAGLLMQQEIEQLDKLKDAVRPYVAVIGGAKLDTKIPILQSLIGKADTILIGGAMAYTFLNAQGIETGKSKIQPELLKQAVKILKDAKKAGTEIVLPVDHIAAKEFAEDADPVVVETQQIPKDLMAMDIGERTMDDFQHIIENAKTIMWNGPMGVFEFEQFARGTEAIGEYIGLAAPKSTFKLAGGGDTITAMEKLKINFKNYNHVSTGGGAMLAYLSGEEFPTLQPLIQK